MTRGLSESHLVHTPAAGLLVLHAEDAPRAAAALRPDHGQDRTHTSHSKPSHDGGFSSRRPRAHRQGGPSPSSPPAGPCHFSGRWRSPARPSRADRLSPGGRRQGPLRLDGFPYLVRTRDFYTVSCHVSFEGTLFLPEAHCPHVCLGGVFLFTLTKSPLVVCGAESHPPTTAPQSSGSSEGFLQVSRSRHNPPRSPSLSMPPAQQELPACQPPGRRGTAGTVSGGCLPLPWADDKGHPCWMWPHAPQSRFP